MHQALITSYSLEATVGLANKCNNAYRLSGGGGDGGVLGGYGVYIQL